MARTKQRRTYLP